MFTNLTQDHLDFHGTMGAYFSAKARLFQGVGAPAPRIAIVNTDDSLGNIMASLAQRAGCLVWRYGLETAHGWGPEFRAENVKMRAGEITFNWKTSLGAVPMRSALTGRVNVYNLLAASCAALARGLSLEQIADVADKLRPVPGRFETIANEL